MRKALVAVFGALLASGAAAAQDKRAAMAFPTVEDCKTKVGFDEEQCKKAEPIVKEYEPKVKEAAAKVKDAPDKKAAFTELRTIRTEGLNKLKEICKDDEQKKKFDEAFSATKKKSQN
jgi:hypothetical protein